MQQHQLAVIFNHVYTTDLEALANKWGISPAAVARRAVRDLLKENGLYDHPQRPPSQTRKPAKPTMVHRTLRLTPTQAGVIDGITDRHQLTRSKTLRALISHACRQPITHQHLHRAPSHKRTVRWSVRLTPQQDHTVTTVAESLRCSLTDAASALLSSAAAQRNLLQQLTQHPPKTTQSTTGPPAGEQHHNRSRKIIHLEGVTGADNHQNEEIHAGQQSRLPL